MKRVFFALLLLILSVVPLFATETFLIDNYHVDAVVEDSSLTHFKEYLALDFITPSHGIIRDLQYRFDAGNFKTLEADITNVRTNVPVEAYYNGDFISLRLGDPDVFVFDKVNYYIEFDYLLEDDGVREYDEWYVNLLSAAWDTNVRSFSFSVTFPHPVDPSRINITYGPYGSTNRLPFSLSSDGRTIVGEVENLGPYSAVTVRAEFDEGYFSTKERKADFGPLFTILFIILAIAFIAFVFYSFLRLGRDEEIIAPVKFSPPEGLSSLDVGYIIDNTITFDKDILSMIFYFADKGYLKIEERGKEDYEFTKLKEIEEDRPSYERRLFNMIFAHSEVASIESLAKRNFAELATSKTRSDAERYYEKNHPLFEPRSMRRASLIRALGIMGVILFSVMLSANNIGELTLLLLFPSLFAFGIEILIGHRYFSNSNISSKVLKTVQIGLVALIASLSFFISFTLLSMVTNIPLAFIASLLNVALIFSSSFFSYAVNKRSEYANQMLSEILGYREFLEKVELDQLRTLIEEDPDYYYHNLSYAIALNLEEEYSKKFKDLSVSNPDWYSGESYVGSYLLWHTFALSWRRGYGKYISQVAPPSGFKGGSRSHGGFSGFSGGGFSGGGGRSW